ncbi:hypothetical protein, partial [Crocosphaera sp.]|uniref:hypothetical protein n=1 Tax=Crocosphaera sp. TaxID=2729996 RepID=UPI00257F6154
KKKVSLKFNSDFPFNLFFKKIRLIDFPFNPFSKRIQNHQKKIFFFFTRFQLFPSKQRWKITSVA